jgi:hypothetical protein
VNPIDLILWSLAGATAIGAIGIALAVAVVALAMAVVVVRSAFKIESKRTRSAMEFEWTLFSGERTGSDDEPSLIGLCPARARGFGPRCCVGL